MRYFFILLTLLIGTVYSHERKITTEESDNLSGHQNFQVLSLLLGEVDQNVVYDSMIDALKECGQVTVDEQNSMIESIFQIEPCVPLCFFTIGKKENSLEVSLDIFSGEKQKSESQKTSPIWKKSLTATIQNENQSKQKITNLTKEMITAFAEDWNKANRNQPKPVFHVTKSKEL